MIATPGRHPAVLRLLEALGLKGKKVRKFSLDFDVRDVVKCYVEIYVTPDEVHSVASTIT